MRYLIVFISGCILGFASYLCYRYSKSERLLSYVYVENTLNPKLIERVTNDSIYKEPYMPDSIINPFISSVVNKRGVIPTAELASQIAYIVISNVYGIKCASQEMPYMVSLVNGRTWVIEGSLNHPVSSIGGTFIMALDKKTGETLYLAHGK